MSSGTCWHCEGDHDTGDCPTRKQWTVEHQPGSPGVDLDELERAYANCDYDLIVDTWPALSRRIRELEAVACAAVVLADAGPGRTSGPMWTLLWTFLNDRVRRSLVPAMKRQGLPFTENDGEWRSEPPPGGAALVGISSAVRGEEQSRAVSLEAELRTLRARVEELERVHAWKVVDLETMIQNEHKLYADAHERMLKAEARVEELECAEAELNLENGRLQDRLNTILTITEQGLEDRVATALGPRYQALQLTRLAMSGIWQACWCAPAWSSRNEREAQAPTLPALLRAILAVEKGGPDEG